MSELVKTQNGEFWCRAKAVSRSSLRDHDLDGMRKKREFEKSIQLDSDPKTTSPLIDSAA
jgi:hypothetical protein